MNKIYNTKYGNVIIDLSKKNIIVRLSGGFDSAVMLYMIADAVIENNIQEEVNIYPITVRRIGQKNNRQGMSKIDPEKIINDIINYVKLKYPSINILNPLIGDLEDWWLEGVYNRYQRILINQIIKDFNLTENTYQNFNGVTKNPDVEFPNTPSGPSPDRNENLSSDWKSVNTVSVFLEEAEQVEPFRNADKRITFCLADQLGVLEDLFEMTWSCEAFEKETNNFTQTCGECWWCAERDWAYKEYNK